MNRIDVLAARRDAIVARLEELDTQVIERSVALDGDDATEYAALEAELPTVIAERDRLIERQELIARSLGRTAPTAVITADPAPVTIPAQPKAEPNPEAIYHRGGEHDPLADLLASARGDAQAAGRIHAHNAENVDVLGRATTTSSLGGLVVPEYLVNEVVPYAREGRPFADVVRKRPLTKHVTTVPRVTTPADMAIVAAQGDAYTSANYATTALDITAKTIGGYVEVSVEAVEFGSLDTGAVFEDLTADYNKKVDYQLFHGSDSNGQLEGLYVSDGLGSVTATSATSGAAELWVKVCEAASQVHAGIFAEPTYLVMSSTRWYALLSELDTDSRPIFGVREGNSYNAAGNADPARGRTFANLPVILDDNIYTATSADTRVVITKADELWLLEQNGGRPTYLTVDSARAINGLVQFIARGFVAWTAERRPKATSIITGLPVPAFV